MKPLLALLTSQTILVAQPFTVQLTGTVPACLPNSVVEIYEEPGLLHDVVAVDGNCSFTATFGVFQPTGTLNLVGTCANGSQALNQFNFEFAAPGDTLALTIALACGGDQVDCLGVTGGTAFPGHPCDDGSASTLLDAWTADCQCVGVDSSLVVFDCLGEPNGPNQPGTPCLLTDPNVPFPIGLWSADCQCQPDSTFGSYTDCLGAVNGPAVSGTPCDDGNASTAIDLWDVSCQCLGYDSSAVVFDCLGVAFGGALPGAPCLIDDLPLPVLGAWDANCTCVPDTTLGALDCLGIPGGGNLPGTPCFTISEELPAGIWNSACECVADTIEVLYFDCAGIPNGPNLVGTGCAYTTDSINFGAGIWSQDCVCIADTSVGPLDCAGLPNGPNQPGTPCFDPNNPFGIGFWDLSCTCIIDTTNAPIDCLGIPGGGNLPGTPCQSIALDGTPNEGIWGPDCFCYGDSTTFVLDCLGQPNGPNMPGTPCLVDSLFPALPVGLWNANCECIADSSFNYVDCLGIENGPNNIGSVCDTGDPNVLGYWNSDCECEAYTAPPCTAGFIVTPGVIDTAGTDPIMLWVFNTSFGGTGVYTYLWEFGDGSTSTDPWPMHDYEGNGPYLLCLTITDSDGCSSTFCDTLAVDENGIFNGFSGAGSRTSGFSVQVRPGEAPTGVDEVAELAEMELWPNPATDRLLISWPGELSGPLDIMVMDMGGRIVLNDSPAVSGNRTDIAVETLRPGLYMIQVTNNGSIRTARFVKE